MEMKSYQRRAIDDLSRYMELLNEAQDYAAAFSQFWQEKSAPALGHYQDILPGVPNLCFKVPTGGGKTFLACNALRPVFDTLPMTKMKAVVWLVPSDAILSQTLKNLQDSSHPYRQAIDVAFGGRVTVYSKQELLSGQNFNITAERVRRVIKGYGQDKNAVEGTGGSFSFYELGEPLLIGENLNEAVGAEKIREYVWFTETKLPYAPTESEEPYYLGANKGAAYYFYYEPQSVTVLDHEFLSGLRERGEITVIYADRCAISPEKLRELGIVFKKIPRDISRL